MPFDRPVAKTFAASFIILICLEKGQKFWKSQGKIREFHQEEKVGTLL